MKRVILVALAVASVLLMTDATRAMDLPQRAVENLVVLDGEPEIPYGTVPINPESVSEDGEVAPSVGREPALSVQHTEPSIRSWPTRWVVIWRWVWALL